MKRILLLLTAAVPVSAQVPLRGVAYDSMQAQAIKTVRSTSMTPCVGCRLQIDSVLTLGADMNDTSYYFETFAQQLAVTNGNLLIVTGNRQPMVFDLRGRFLRRLGRRGSGPGEFPLDPFRFWVAPGDELHFLVRHYEMVVVYRTDGTFVRQYNLSHSARNPARLADGRIVAGHPLGQYRDANQVHDYPLFRVFSSSGKLEKEIARGVTVADAGVSVGVDGTVWTWKSFPYSLRQWTAAGQQLLRFDRITPTFGTGEFSFDPWRPFQARVVTVQQHEDRLLWVTYVDEPLRKNCQGIETCLTTTVEVLDPESGALIASTKVPVALGLDMGKGYFASYRVSMGKGAPVVIYRATLVRPPSRSTPQ